jgi:hypothetical protein
MKKATLFATLAACAVALIATICVLTSSKPEDMRVQENVEALASDEGGECKGPKKMIWFTIFCQCTNDEPCSDNYNCNS